MQILRIARKYPAIGFLDKENKWATKTLIFASLRLSISKECNPQRKISNKKLSLNQNRNIKWRVKQKHN